MNVVVNLDKKALFSTSVMLHSLCSNNLCNITIYFFVYRPAQKMIKRIQQLEYRLAGHDRFQRKCIIIEIPDNLQEMLPDSRCWAKAAWYRIFVKILLPKEIDRILFLDGDLIITDDIQEFYGMEMNQFYIAACRDTFFREEDKKESEERLGIPWDDTYFNTGVILFDMVQCNSILGYENVKRNLKEIGNRCVRPDQDFLNVLFAGKVKLVDEEIYNLFFTTGHYDKSTLDNSNAKILHFTGGKYNKPWLKTYRDCYADQFWKYARLGGYWIRYYTFLVTHFLYTPFNEVDYRLKPKKQIKNIIFILGQGGKRNVG